MREISLLGRISAAVSVQFSSSTAFSFGMGGFVLIKTLGAKLMIIKEFHIDKIRRMLTRWQKGISQKQLAIKFRIPPHFIDRTEIGRYTHLSLIKKLLIFYNKEIRIELVDRENSNTL